MAELSSVSDTQVLLQSMLQKLKLQTHSDTSTQQQTPLPLIEDDVMSAESSSYNPIYLFGASLETKQQRRIESVCTKPDNPWIFQSSGLKGVVLHPPKQPASVHNSGISTWDSTNSRTVSEGNSDVTSSTDVVKTSRWMKKRQKFLRRRTSEDNWSVSSFPTIGDTVEPTISLLSPPSGVPDYREDNMGGVRTGTEDDKTGGDISVRESSTRTSRNKKKEDPGHKRWTQKVKERWRERHRRVEKRDKSEHEVVQACHSPAFTQTSENITTTALGVEVSHSHPISSGSDEAPPSLLDHMSEPIFSFGSFNLMEEIFSGQEWAKFFPASTSNQSEPSCTRQDQATESSSSISQLCQEKQTIIRQWNYKDTTESNLSMPPLPMNSGGLQEDMDTNEKVYNQTKASDFSMSLLNKGHIEHSDPSGSNQRAKSMNPNLSYSQKTEPTKDQSRLLERNLNNQRQTDVTVQQSLSGDHSLNHSHTSDQAHRQSQSMNEETLPLFDISYLQAKDSNSSRTHGSLSRKRGHRTISRNLGEQDGSQAGEAEEWREDAIIPLYSPCPDDRREDTMPLCSPRLAPRFSPTSSVSSARSSQDSESSTNTETVVKKRRVENTRRVRFAEEVLILPPLILSDDDDDNDDDGDDDIDYKDGGNDDDKSDEEFREDPLPHSSVSSWIVALRSKAKKKAKLKQITSPRTTHRTSKKTNFM